MPLQEASYAALVDMAADEAVETGMIDLVRLAEVAERGFNVDAFQSDVAELVEIIHIFGE